MMVAHWDHCSTAGDREETAPPSGLKCITWVSSFLKGPLICGCAWFHPLTMATGTPLTSHSAVSQMLRVLRTTASATQAHPLSWQEPCPGFGPSLYCARLELDGNKEHWGWLLFNVGWGIVPCWLGGNIQTLVPHGTGEVLDYDVGTSWVIGMLWFITTWVYFPSFSHWFCWLW